MAKNLLKKLGRTGIYVVEGDIIQYPTSAIMTAINSGAMWFGGVDGAIQRVAGSHYHAQACKSMPLEDKQVVIANGGTFKHRGQFRDVVFVVDDLQSPLNEIVYAGLEGAHGAGYQTLAMPSIRMGVMAGQVERTPEETVQKLGKGILDFLDAHGYKTPLEKIAVVVYKDERTLRFLNNDLSRLGQSKAN